MYSSYIIYRPTGRFKILVFMSKVFTSIKDYFRGAMSEMKKVVWPTQKQTTQYSIAVIIMSIFVAVFFGILDYFFSNLLGALIAL
jgi:preprotein translocase subunit SecE